MKAITIIGAEKIESTYTLHRVGKDLVVYGDDQMSIFDGHHTLDELYEHRFELYIALCKQFQRPEFYGDSRNHFGDGKVVWRSKVHSDGTSYDGWFILGIFKAFEHQITYHLPLSRWDETAFAETLDKAPAWDGHKPQDVLNRLKSL